MSSYAFRFLPPVSPENQIHLQRYKTFIWSRLLREIPEGTYTERHHIWPVSLGSCKGVKKQRWNIITLTAREHILAHLMLAKAYGNNLWYSLNYTLNGHNQKDISFSFISKILENQKFKAAYIISEETRQTMSKVKTEMYQNKEMRKLVSIRTTEAMNDPELKQYLSSLRKGKTYEEIMGVEKSIETKRKKSESAKGENNHFYGKQHSEEAIKKIKEANAIFWITNEIENLYYKKSELENFILPEGYRFGKRPKRKKEEK